MASDDLLRKEDLEYPLEKEDHFIQIKSSEYFLKKFKPSRRDIWKLAKKPTDKELASDYELSE